MIELINRETGEILDTDSVPGLAEVAALHDQRISQLAELVDDLLPQGEGTPGSGQGPVVWAQLTSVERQRTWRSLAEWVGWLRSRYPLAHRVPPCWWRHPELVEELTALWLAWREAYVEKGAVLSSGADWHNRWLPELLRRIGAGGWNLACEGDHRPAVSSLYDGREVDDLHAFEEAINAADTAAPDGPGGKVMNDDQMRRAIEAGEAREMGALPGSPVELDGEYWVNEGDTWSTVRSSETITFLQEADRRMGLADQAVRESERS